MANFKDDQLQAEKHERVLHWFIIKYFVNMSLNQKGFYGIFRN